MIALPCRPCRYETTCLNQLPSHIASFRFLLIWVHVFIFIPNLVTLCSIFFSSWSRHTAKVVFLTPLTCTLSTFTSVTVSCCKGDKRSKLSRIDILPKTNKTSRKGIIFKQHVRLSHLDRAALKITQMGSIIQSGLHFADEVKNSYK